MPQFQKLGAHWHLTGSLKRPATGIFPLSLNRLSQGHGELTLVRKFDGFSPHISVAQTNQLVIPKLTVTTPSGGQVIFHHVHIKGQSDVSEYEEVAITFQKIEIEHKGGKKSDTDNWSSTS
jgi:type VI protein secretion system component Hcp